MVRKQSHHQFVNSSGSKVFCCVMLINVLQNKNKKKKKEKKSLAFAKCRFHSLINIENIKIF